VTGADYSEVDIDLLADYIGGALTGTPEESAVAARIAGDPSWRAAYESLGEGMTLVAAELGRLTPEPMPAELADRLDILLTSHPGLDTGTAPDATAPDPTGHLDTVPPGPTDHLDTVPTSPSGLDTGTAAIADPEPIAPDLAKPPVPHLALVRGGPTTDDTRGEATDDARGQTADDTRGHTAEDTLGQTADDARGDAADDDARGDAADDGTRGDVAGDGTRGDAGHDGARAGADDDRAHGVRKIGPTPRRGRRLRWAAPIAVAAGLIAFVGFGLDYLAGTRNESASTDSGAAPGVAAQGYGNSRAADATLATGTDYTHATLGQPPAQPMTAPLPASAGPGRKSTPDMAIGAQAALRRLTAPTALADCLAAIERANGSGPLSPESVDYARYNGKPAVIVRFTAANGHWAWASGADCGTPAGDPDTLDKVPVG